MDTITILYFISYFILYSFAGWVLESTAKTIDQRKFVNSGFLKGPFCPIYGFGTLIMLLCLGFLKQNVILLFISSFFILSIWEYIVGFLLEKIFKTKYWDYSHLKFNIHGRVCLKNSLIWGILAVLFIYFLHPFIESYIVLVPTNILLYINIIILIAITVDLIVSIIEVFNFESAIKRINELGDSIKEKTEELKELNTKLKLKTEEFEKNSTQNIEKIIKDLKMTQTKLKLKIYKKIDRLKRAFPSMKSDNITKFLNQKIDLKELKKSIKKKNKE